MVSHVPLLANLRLLELQADKLLGGIELVRSLELGVAATIDPLVKEASEVQVRVLLEHRLEVDRLDELLVVLLHVGADGFPEALVAHHTAQHVDSPRATRVQMPIKAIPAVPQTHKSALDLTRLEYSRHEPVIEHTSNDRTSVRATLAKVTVSRHVQVVFELGTLKVSLDPVRLHVGRPRLLVNRMQLHRSVDSRATSCVKACNRP